MSKTMRCGKHYVCDICQMCQTHCTGHVLARNEPHNYDSKEAFMTDKSVVRCQQLYRKVRRKGSGEMVDDMMGRADAPYMGHD